MIAAPRPDDYDARADGERSYALAIAFCRRVLELRAAYGLLPSEARRLAMREAQA